MIGLIRGSLPAETRNPALLLAFLDTIIGQACKPVLAKKLWFNKNDFIEITNFLAKEEGTLVGRKWVKYFVIGICAIYCTAAFLIWGKLPQISPLYQENKADFNFKNWREGTITCGRQIFFIDGIKNGRRNATMSYQTIKEGFSGFDIFLGVSASAGLLHRF